MLAAREGLNGAEASHKARGKATAKKACRAPSATTVKLAIQTAIG